MAASPLLDFSNLLLQFIFVTVLHDAMENGSRHWGMLVWAGARLGDEEIGFILLKVSYKCAAICLVE